MKSLLTTLSIAISISCFAQSQIHIQELKGVKCTSVVLGNDKQATFFFDKDSIIYILVFDDKKTKTQMFLSDKEVNRRYKDYVQFQKSFN